MVFGDVILATASHSVNGIELAAITLTRHAAYFLHYLLHWHLPFTYLHPDKQHLASLGGRHAPLHSTPPHQLPFR